MVTLSRFIQSTQTVAERMINLLGKIFVEENLDVSDDKKIVTFH